MLYGRQILNLLTQVNQKVDKLMSEQADINADVTAIQAAVTALAAEIASLKASNPALDLTGLDAAVASLTALAAPPATPPATA